MMFQHLLTKPSLRAPIFAIGNLAAAITILFLIVVPIRDFFADRDAHIADQRALLARLKSIVAQAQNVRFVEQRTLEQLKRGEFIVGPNDGIINADLQTRLKAKAVQSGAQLRSIQALPPKSTDGVRYLGTQLDIYGPLPAIQRTLYAIEHGTPYHFISAALIKPSHSAQSRGTSAEPTIDARLEIFVGVQLDGKSP